MTCSASAIMARSWSVVGDMVVEEDVILEGNYSSFELSRSDHERRQKAV
jgi:hypothetical protein